MITKIGGIWRRDWAFAKNIKITYPNADFYPNDNNTYSVFWTTNKLPNRLCGVIISMLYLSADSITKHTRGNCSNCKGYCSEITTFIFNSGRNIRVCPMCMFKEHIKKYWIFDDFIEFNVETKINDILVTQVVAYDSFAEMKYFITAIIPKCVLYQKCISMHNCLLTGNHEICQSIKHKNIIDETLFVIFALKFIDILPKELINMIIYLYRDV